MRDRAGENRASEDVAGMGRVAKAALPDHGDDPSALVVPTYVADIRIRHYGALSALLPAALLASPAAAPCALATNL
jgi:hypothetical protein